MLNDIQSHPILRIYFTTLFAIIYQSEHERWIPGETKMAICVVTIIQKLDFDCSWLLLQLFIPPLQLVQTCWSSWCCKWWGDVLRIVSGRSTVFPSFGDELIMRGRIGDELTFERSIVFPEVLSPSSAGVPSWGKYVQSFWDYSIVRNCYMCILLAPSGALIAIPTYYWSTTHHPTFSDHTGPQHWTFTFWATTAI